MQQPKKILFKIGRIFLWCLVGLITLFVVIVLLIRTPWAQQFIVEKATGFVSGKIHTPFRIQKLYITFTGNVQLEGLYVEDQQEDTLLYSRSLEVGVALLPLINGNINVSKVNWDGLRANVRRSLPDSSFNFDYIIAAFAGKDTAAAEAPDTAAGKPLQLDLGPVTFTDFVLSYTDEVSGMDAHLNLGNLFLTTKTLDLEKMHFHIRELTLEKTDAKIIQTLPAVPSPEDTTESVLPHLQVDVLNLREINLYYADADSLLAKVYLHEFSLELPEADLQGQKIELDKLLLANSDIYLRMPAPADTVMVTDTLAAATAFVLPDWQIQVGSVRLDNNRIAFHSGGGVPLPNTFDAAHLEIDSLTLHLEKIYLKGQTAGLDLKEFRFRERSGFRLNQLAMNTSLQKDRLEVKDLQLRTGNSRMDGQLQIGFVSLDSLLQAPASSQIALSLKETVLSLQDAFYFSPELRQDTLLGPLAGHPLYLEASVKGRMNAIDIKKISASWGSSTQFYTAGTIKGLPDMEKLSFDIPLTTFSTTRQDVAFLLPQITAVQIPASASLKMTVKGSMNELTANLGLSTPDGKLGLAGTYRDQGNRPAFNGNLQLTALEVGKIMKTPDAGKVSAKIAVNGTGNSLETLDATFDAVFQELEVKGYNYQGLALKGGLQHQLAKLHMDYSDTNLQVRLDAGADLDTLHPAYQLDLDLLGANFYGLNVTRTDVRARFKLKANFTGTPENFTTRVEINDATVRKEKETYPVANFLLTASANAGKTELDISSDIVDARLRANTDPESFVNAISRQMENYFKAPREKETPGNATLEARIDFYKTRLVSEVLVPGLDALDSANLQFTFRERDNYLKADLSIPYVVYSGTEVTGLYAQANSNQRKLQFAAGFGHVVSGPADIYRTAITGNFATDSLIVALNMQDQAAQTLINLAASLVPRGDTSLVHIDHQQLILNRESWKIPQGNAILIGEKVLVFRNFELSQGAQKLALRSSVDTRRSDLAVEFEHFQLSTFTSLVNPQQSPVAGELHGEVLLQELFTKPAFTAGLVINKLAALGQELGKLTVDADNLQANTYRVKASMGGNGVEFDLKGSYVASETAAKLQLDFDLKELQLAVAQHFSDSAIRNAEGSLRGKFSVEGTTDNLQYAGNLRFDKAKVNVTALNADFTLANEQIRVDNKGIYFKGFDIVDGKGSRSTLNGTIGTEDMTNPTLDLRFTANNFELLNSTRKDNDVYFGKVLLDADIRVEGSVASPQLNVRTKLNKGTAVTFIVPESQVDVVDRDGVVIFANIRNPDDILTNEKEQKTSGYTGIDLRAIIEIDPATSINVIVDERSGDNLMLTGAANLSFDMYPNGRMALSGNYEIGSGHYEMSLYDIVKRRFDIAPGSRVTWAGDPLDAQLDLKALYTVSTPAVDLMSDQLTTADPASRNRYRQNFPFEVYLIIKGVLLKPQISFALDMPEDERSALGGSIYGRLQQLNEQESELNKQVFALLVLKRFLPTGAAVEGESGNSTEAAAKSSVSQLLSGQLNNLSDKYVKGVELDLNLDSYTDYQSGAAQDRTQLNVSVKKALFNDRVIVQVGSQVDLEGSPQAQQGAGDIIGDISLEYLITKDGRYRTRGFRKNQFEGVIEGQLVVTGVSLVYLREFNTLRELWKKPVPADLPRKEEPEDEPEKEEAPKEPEK